MQLARFRLWRLFLVPAMCSALATGAADPPDTYMRSLQRGAETGGAAEQVRYASYLVGRKNYVEALTWYLKAARDPSERGATAAYTAGFLYARGRGTGKDLGEAARWYQVAADRGNPAGQLALALMYLDGNGVPKNAEVAAQMLGRALDQGYAPARTAAFLMHVEGIGTAVDPKKAASILARRPVKDDAEMAFLIGSFYDGNLYIDEDQRPVFTWYLSRAAFPEDKVEAYLDTVDRYNEANRAREWYLKGAQGDHLGAQYSLATLYFRGHEPPDWDCGEGMKWLRRAADGGDGIAQFNMGWIYLRGMDRKEVVIGVQVAQASDGVEVKSVTASGPAARSGLRAGDVVVKVDSRMRLGSVSSGPLKVEEFAERIGKGKGEAIALEVRRPGRDATLTLEVTPREIVIECPGAKAAGLMVDPAEAFRWFQKAAETGNISGLFYVATAYRDGKGVGKDTVKAVELFEKGSARGDWQAALALYEIYAGGNGVEKDKTRAEEWYRKALDLKHRSVGTR